MIFADYFLQKVDLSLKMMFYFYFNTEIYIF